MKKIILLTCFSIFLISGMLGQEIDFKYKVDSTDTNPKQYTVTVTITKGHAPFSINLYDGIPWQGGKEIKSITGVINIYKFSDLNKGMYFIAVKSENDELSAGKAVKIK